jgi:hypothetical protein
MVAAINYRAVWNIHCFKCVTFPEALGICMASQWRVQMCACEREEHEKRGRDRSRRMRDSLIIFPKEEGSRFLQNFRSTSTNRRVVTFQKTLKIFLFTD